MIGDTTTPYLAVECGGGGGGFREICVDKIRWADVVRPHKRLGSMGVFCPRASETDMFWSVPGLASGVARGSRS
jgi:hypothetical protein